MIFHELHQFGLDPTEAALLSADIREWRRLNPGWEEWALEVRLARLLPVVVGRLYGYKFTDLPKGRRWPASREGEPFTASDLTTDVLGRLLARADARAARRESRERREHGDRFWLGAELRLILTRAHPRTVRRWRHRIGWRVRHTTEALAAWQRLEDLLLAHEPEPDAWLRQQLETLTDGEPRC